MPRESTITYDHVAAVADAIKAQGGRPTSRNVRERIGQGSMGTIHRMLSQWQAGQARNIDATLALPPALQRAILEFMAQELANGRASIEAELAEAQQAGADLATENERLVAEVDGLCYEIAAQHDQITAATEQRNLMAADLDNARKEVSQAQQSAELVRTELAKAQLRLESMPRLESEAIQLRADLHAERTARADAERLAAAADARADGLAARLSDSNARIADLQRRLQETEAQAREAASQAKSEMLARIDAEAKVAMRQRGTRSNPK